MQAIYVNGAI